MKTEKPRDEFMERVQTHERDWGNELYPDRPSLVDILSASVVTFWQPTDPKVKNPYIVLYNDLREVEKWFIQTLMRVHVSSPDRRLIAIYENRRKVRIKSVRVEFDTDAST